MSGDGFWAAWSQWADCSQTCGGGTKFRARACAFEPGHPHGEACEGDSEEHASCIIQECSCTFEPPQHKTNKMTCAPSEDSDQPGRMPWLIWVFAGRTCHFVGFGTRGLVSFFLLHFRWNLCHFQINILGFEFWFVCKPKFCSWKHINRHVH